MKKKIVVLLLLILAGMGVFLSQNGWCMDWRRALQGRNHNPWGEINCLRVTQNSPNMNSNTNVDTENSVFDINLSRAMTLTQRGKKSLDSFQKKEQSSVKVTK